MPKTTELHIEKRWNWEGKVIFAVLETDPETNMAMFRHAERDTYGEAEEFIEEFIAMPQADAGSGT